MEEKAWEGEDCFMTKYATSHQDAETLVYEGTRVAAKVKLGSSHRVESSERYKGFAKMTV